jgi:hypothetical protein
MTVGLWEKIGFVVLATGVMNWGGEQRSEGMS